MSKSMLARIARHAAIITPLAIGLMGGAATAALASDNAQGALYSNNFYCGGAFFKTPNLASGFIVVHKTDATHVSINYHIENGTPGATYFVNLETGFCTYNSFLGEVKVNSNGVGNANFDNVAIPAGATELFTYSTINPFSFATSIESVEVPLSS